MEAKAARLFSSAVSRRAFLAGAAAAAASGPLSSRGFAQLLAPAFLHVGGTSRIETFAIHPNECRFLGSTDVESFAAYAAHPALPVLYVARDCHDWVHLPRGVVESYAVECSSHPFRLLGQTPMSLSATGPRSIAVSSCGRYLLASASTGGAWNAFVLGKDGIPASVAMARKETGSSAVLPRPHALAFSPRGLCAVGTDPGCGRMTLLRPSADGVAVLARCDAAGLGHAAPVWTHDGKYVIATDADRSSLSVYEVSGDGPDIHRVSTIRLNTPIEAMLAHPAESGVFTARREGAGSRVEFWALRRGDLRIEKDAAIADRASAMSGHGGNLWLVSEDRVACMERRDLRCVGSWSAPRLIAGMQAVITRGGNVLQS